jgi:hypothetical protein
MRIPIRTREVPYWAPRTEELMTLPLLSKRGPGAAVSVALPYLLGLEVCDCATGRHVDGE